jgi:SAM-dependent methyltransferase
MPAKPIKAPKADAVILVAFRMAAILPRCAAGLNLPPPERYRTPGMSILLSVLFLLVMVFLMSTIWTNLHGAPWVPTPRGIVRRMLRLAAVRPGELVYDLGCGDGRVLVTAARSFGARAVGIEIDVSRFLWSLAVVGLLGLWGRVRVIRGDLFKQDLRKADVVVTYLLQETNDRLQAKLLRELRPGARVVTNTFSFPGLRLAASDEEYRLYLYRIGPAVKP